MAAATREPQLASRPPVVIEATLEGMGDRLRLSIHLNDGYHLEERSMTVVDRSEAERQVTSFAAGHPGFAVERRGDAWKLARPANA
jgi:hypothetical protein